MPDFCPSCGTKIEDGMNFCQNCGAQLQTKKVASTFEEQVAQSPDRSVPVQIQPAPISQQQIGQKQAYSPMQLKKSNTKLIIGVVVAIFAIVIVLLIVVLFFGGFFGGASSADFVGQWEVTSMMMDGQVQGGSSGYITFQSDGIFTASGNSGIWELRNNKVYIDLGFSSEEYYNFGFSYEFTNNNNQLILTYSGNDNNGDYHTISMILIKVDTKSNGNGGADDRSDGSDEIDSRIVGVWEYIEETSDITMIYEFKSSGSFEFGTDEYTYPMGTWSVNGDQLCMMYTGTDTEQCYTYSLSGDGNQMTWDFDFGIDSIILTKR